MPIIKSITQDVQRDWWMMNRGQHRWYIIVNAISAGRIIVPFIVFLGLYPAVRAGNAAGSVWWTIAIVLMAGTDFIDGPLARHYDVESQLGILDHTTDKICLGSGLLVWLILVAQSSMPDFYFWISLIVVAVTVVFELYVVFLNRNPDTWSDGAVDDGRKKYALQGLALVVIGVSLAWFYHNQNLLMLGTILANMIFVTTWYFAAESITGYRRRLKLTI
jgi:phosphatidylglycerophosphate synthase